MAANHPATPRNGVFDDLYASAEDPVGEKQHVYVAANHLPPRFSALAHDQFVIAEIGFGFGTAFLLTFNAWCHAHRGNSHLHYVAVEGYPVGKADLSQWHKQTGLDAGALLDAWPLPVRGVHHINFAGNVHLTLIFEPLADGIKTLPDQVDCWFLDGFSPSKNASAWTPELMGVMQANSRPGATASTYTVAGHIRAGLNAAGFVVRKTPGFGQKREMSSATRPGTWRPRPCAQTSVAVVGAGLAGRAVTAALRRHNADVLAIAPDTPPAGRQLGVFPYLSKQPEAFSRFSLAALLYARASYGPLFHEGGFLRASDTRNLARLQAMAAHFVDQPRVARWHAGNNIVPAGVHFDLGGWVTEQELAPRRQSGAYVNDQVADMTFESGHWRTFNRAGLMLSKTDEIVLCTGAGFANLPALNPLAMQALPGSTANVRLQPEPPLFQVVSGSFTLFPAHDGTHTLGATWPTARNPVTMESLVSKVALHFGCSVEVLSTEAGNRCTTRDRIPAVGRLPAQAGTSLPTPWVCTAFGSRGATHTPLCAEILAAQILDLPIPASPVALAAMDPGRFVRRDTNRPKTPKSTRGRGKVPE